MQENAFTKEKKNTWLFKKIIPLHRFFKLIRLQNLFIILFTQAMIRLFLLPVENYFVSGVFFIFFEKIFWLVSLSTIFIAIAGYIINDYYDVKIDMINRPHTVIIGKELHRRWAIFLNIFFNLFGLFLAFLVGFKVGVITLASAVLLWWYSNNLKRKPLLGNLAIAILTAMTILLMWFAYPYPADLDLLLAKDITEKIMIFALFAFFITLIRELVKDMEDVKGDHVFGCKTLPIVWGIRRSKNVGYVFVATFLVLLWATFFTYRSGFVLYLLGVIFPLMCFFVYKLKNADRKKDFYFLSQFCKMVMILGVFGICLI